MLKFIINLFKKEKEKESYPYKFVKVELNDIAKSKGIIDNYNREIKIYENGGVVQVHNYTKELLESIRINEKIPIYWEDYNYEEEDFEFYPFEDLNTIKFKK